MAEEIDLGMSWEQATQVYCLVLEEGSLKGRETARAEMMRMAWLADNAFKPLELMLCPMCDGRLAERFDEVTSYDVILRPEGSDPIAEYENLTQEQAVQKSREMHEKYPQAFFEDLRDLLT